MTSILRTSPVQPASTSRTRSFGGCSTCRYRHVKCDETRPVCGNCSQRGLVCSGFKKKVVFNFGEEHDESGVARFRQTLFTDAERKSMSLSITSIVPPHQASKQVSKIDELCEATMPGAPVQITRGPFGAFRLDTWSATESREELEDPCVEDDVAQDLIIYSRTDGTSSGVHYDPTMFPDYNLDGSLSCLGENTYLIPSLDLWDIMPESPSTNLRDNDSRFELGQQLSNQDPADSFEISGFCLGINGLSGLDDIIQPSRSPSEVPQDAVFLLKHFITKVIALLTPFRHAKTPWHILFVPHVKHCLAALTMGEELDHASRCVFYGTLALSAFSLGGVFQSDMWLKQGELYRQKARHHIRLMLKAAYDIPKTAKYKSILLALMTMIHLSLFCANRDQTECYFLEAEKFIRLRGLDRRKSRKVRLLHHCYVFERLFYESTLTGSTNSSQRQHVLKAVEKSGLIVYGQDSASFCLPAWRNLNLEMRRVKTQIEGENDLFLEKIGDFPDTFYPEIFGVPESSMLLFSLIIRLDKEKNDISRRRSSNPLNLQEFLARAKTLETQINQLQGVTVNRNPPARMEGQVDSYILDNMLEAFHHALSIYFYRKIYDIDALMLQSKVIAVRDCLLRCDLGEDATVYASISFLWPASIAASEAEDADLRSSFSLWFQTVARRSGLSFFQQKLDVIEQIWMQKTFDGDPASLLSAV